MNSANFGLMPIQELQTPRSFEDRYPRIVQETRQGARFIRDNFDEDMTESRTEEILRFAALEVYQSALEEFELLIDQRYELLGIPRPPIPLDSP